MSMLIEGVDMPRGTNMMLLISPEGEVWKMGDLLGNDKLIDGAKAVPVSPHGRCIDADALIKELAIDDLNDHNGATLLMAVFLEVLKAAPTIIPAEDGEA